MIERDDVLVELCGTDDVEAFKKVMGTSMRLADAIKQVIAEDLAGRLPSEGKRFLETREGVWRLAPRDNSDNATEERANKRLGARLVQVFGPISAKRRARGWIGVDELYAIHGVPFDQERLVAELRDRLSVGAPADG